MMRPVPFTWPYSLAFTAVMLWVFIPENTIVRNARKAAKSADSPDAGSIGVIMLVLGISTFLAFPLASVPALRVPDAARMFSFFLGLGILVCGSLLRRHCWRQLGASFTGDVRARADQVVVQTGAYSVLRHPSYSAAMVMNLGIGVSLGSWGSIALLMLASIVAYSYRIAVEERTLATVIGEPYRTFMRGRARLIPFVY
jgi:protein-S-isoprenylcysteine O-methyltransferase Ste14